MPQIVSAEVFVPYGLILRDCTPIPGNCGGGIALMTEIDATRRIGHVLAVLHLSPFIDALDHFLAQLRGRLSRFVPDGTAPRRFP